MALFFRKAASYKRRMRRIFGWGRRLGAVLSDNRGGPWGPGGGGDGGRRRRRRRPAQPLGPRAGASPDRPATASVTSLDEFLKKSRDRFGGRFPPRTGGPIGSTA